MNEEVYVGIDRDTNGGFTHIGRLIMDAWALELLPENETCAGWTSGQLQALHQQVSAAWDKLGQLPSRLPEPYRSRHERIYREAMARGRQRGWDPELGEDD